MMSIEAGSFALLLFLSKQCVPLPKCIVRLSHRSTSIATLSR
jgi:hypothetical protein